MSDCSFLPVQAAPTAELDRSEDKVYQSVMDLVKVVVQLKNDVPDLQPEQYITIVKVSSTFSCLSGTFTDGL